MEKEIKKIEKMFCQTTSKITKRDKMLALGPEENLRL